MKTSTPARRGGARRRGEPGEAVCVLLAGASGPGTVEVVPALPRLLPRRARTQVRAGSPCPPCADSAGGRGAGVLGRARRGFSLVEVAVVIGLSTLVLLLLLRWITALVTVSASTLDRSSQARDASVVSSTLYGDLVASLGCNPYGLDAPFRELGPERFELHADVVAPDGSRGGDGVADLVVWRIEDGRVDRAVVAGTGTCDFDLADPDWVVLAAGVRSSADPLYVDPFRPVADGVVVEDGSAYGSCAGLDADDCVFEALDVTIVLESQGRGDTVGRVDATFPVTTSWSNL